MRYITRPLGILLLVWFYLAPEASFAMGVDFTERTYFHADGSGLFSLQVDLQKSKPMIDAIKYLNKDYGKLASLIGYHAFASAKQHFKSIPGISDIRISHHPKRLLFTLRFTFSHIKALNQLMAKIMDKIDGQPITYFSLSNEIFIREDIHGMVKKIMHYHHHDYSLISSLAISTFFKHSTYTTIYTFPKKIKHASNPWSEITKDQQTIRIVYHLLSSHQIQDSIINRIHFE